MRVEGKNNNKNNGKMKGDKRDQRTAMQLCQPLRKLRIRKREEEKGKKK